MGFLNGFVSYKIVMVYSGNIMGFKQQYLGFMYWMYWDIATNDDTKERSWRVDYS